MNVAVLLSGGVDSSVALRLAQQAGHEVTAFYLKIWLEDELAFLGDCPWDDDLHYARAVCEQAGVPLEVIPLQQEYFERVVDHAIHELRQGRTPSPDILCNQRVKFGAFFEAINGGFDKIASGHYAQIAQEGDTYLLKRSPDPVKDQTYFLSNLSQAQVSSAMFPIGTYAKHEVRALAESFNLPNRNRKDSQGICFLGKIKYNDFVKSYLGEHPGPIIDIDTGRHLGTHKGYWFHTIGQRRGLGLHGGPWYVVRKGLGDNIVYVSHSDQMLRQARHTFEVAAVNWIAGPPTNSEIQVKIRHSPRLDDCKINLSDSDCVRVTLAAAETGIAPGQHAVFYDGDICLGGGVIQ